jgi:hypothetical protein
MSGLRSDSGKRLCQRWGVPAQGYFDKNGKWYHVPQSFPAALCDPRGYILFRAEKDLAGCAGLAVGKTIHVPSGISKLQGYRRMP